MPFVPHYVYLQVIIPWFNSLTKERQKKVYFLPNRYQKTKEQQEGLKELDETRQAQKAGTILLPLSHRSALYGAVLNGSSENFFSNQKKSTDTYQVFKELFKYHAKNK